MCVCVPLYPALAKKIRLMHTLSIGLIVYFNFKPIIHGSYIEGQPVDTAVSLDTHK